MKKILNQSGVIHTVPLLVIVASVGIISYLLISSTAPFKGGLFGILNSKPFSHAAGTLIVTGVAADHSAAKIYFNPVAGAKDYRIYDVTNPNNVKYGGLIRLTPGGECPGYVCNTHFVMQADGVTPVFPYQIASGATGGSQALDVPQVQIDYNGLGDGQPHTLVVEAVDKLGPVPHANLYDGFNLALNIPFVSPLPASAMLGGNKGPTDDGKISTNGQGPYTNNPQVIAQSQPFVVQANRSYQAIPSKSSATQTFFDTFENSQTSTLTQTARNDNYTDSFGTLGSMDYTLNSGTPKAWNIMIRSANNRDTMPFISSDHFMDVLFDGATPGVAAPTHTIYGNLSLIPSPNIDISNGKILHLTTELDGHNSFRRWWAFNLSTAADPLRRFDFHNGAISNTNQGLFLEFRDFDCELSIFTGPSSTTSAPTSTGSIPFNCDRNHLFLNKNLTHNGIGLDNKSRFDLYLSQTHIALFQDGQLISQSDIPAGSFPWANQPLKAYFTHYLYHSDVDDDDVKGFELNQQPMCYPLNSYWFNDPVRGTTASSNVCNLTYPPGYGFPYSDEKHWDNMGFEVLPASDVPAGNDFSSFASLVALPQTQAPQFVGGVSPVPTATSVPTSVPTSIPTLAPTATPNPVPTPTPPPSGGQVGTWQQVAVFNNAPGAYGTRDVVNDRNRPSDFYAVGQNGSPYLTKSTNYGQTWTQIIPQSGSASLNGVYGMSIAPSVGTGPATLLIGAGSGFWKSVDGGLNWLNIPIVLGATGVYGPVVDPYDPNHLLMPAHEAAAVYQSTNAGQTWTSVNIAGGMVSSGTPFVFYINTGSAGTTRNTWLYTNQDSNGTWRTTNGGATWTKVSNCTHDHGADQIYQPDTSGVVYMSGPFCTVQRSTDYGVTWAAMWPQNSGPLVNGLTVVFGTPNKVYAEKSGASGCCGPNGPSLATASQPGTAGLWAATGTPAGMFQGAGSTATAFDGSHWIIVTANWAAGIWRYVEPAPGGGPNPTPTPTPAPPTCAITGATWGSSTVTAGTSVSLTITGNGGCSGQSANVQVRRNGLTLDDIPAVTQPTNPIFNGNTATTTWIAEHSPLIPFTDPDYYFNANLTGQAAIQSNPRNLHVTSPVACVDCSATFLKQDSTTQGTWKGNYGSNGYSLEADGQNLPSYAAVAVSGAQTFTWSGSTTDIRGLQKASSTTDRLAATWYDGNSFIIDVNLTDGQTHKVSLYSLDWDSNQRVQTVDVLDVSSGSVISSHSLSSFNGGTYLSWIIGGHVQFRVTRTGGANAVVSGIFFDSPFATTPIPTIAPTPVPTPLTQGSVVTITAAGQSGVFNGVTVKPQMIFQINGVNKQTWNNVGGNGLANQFLTFTYTSPTKVTHDQVRVRFTNDQYNASTGQDVNLYVQKINIDGVNFPSNAPSVFSNGVWTQQTGCSGGNKQSIELSCNGFFQY